MAYVSGLLREGELKHYLLLDQPPSEVRLSMHFGIPREIRSFRRWWSKLIPFAKREPTEIPALERQRKHVEEMRGLLIGELKRAKKKGWVAVNVEPLERRNGIESPSRLHVFSKNDDGKAFLRELAGELRENKIKEAQSWEEFVELSKLDVGLKEKV